MKATRIVIVSIAIVVFATVCRSQWAQGHGPYGGTVYSFASDGNVLLAAVDASSTATGVYRSTDNGVSWSGPISGLPTGYWRLFVNGNDIFANRSTNGTALLDLYSSSDHGVTWTRATTPPRARAIDAFTELNGTLFVATDSGLFTSKDNGANWTLEPAVADKQGRRAVHGIEIGRASCRERV